jgi:hypothetical protein
MDDNFPLDPKELRKFNIIRYRGEQPTWDLVEKVIKKSGLKFMFKFEDVWGIPNQTLKRYKSGRMFLPAKYWHIFYDFELVNKTQHIKLHKKNKSTKIHSQKGIISSINKNIIDGGKQQLKCSG